ncbi:hypothetical protein [Sphingobium yanoikuyae]|uniref:DUF3137 domain-containing protein n=1 Tax=Sphingobium yanoikuyae ATCC 51230 TaxID=883163 RepID=K9CQ84_SPHYA|nr:hypothetical protein [Sphingobium yanoikuyae]EKU74103.1 hypothetical protein HMPREF9718_03220 [Sphingobium yanoikuyae ATCC 51230]WQE07555.1 hypothetical protein U0025_01350 [Sphingobium yanoikuyae]
MTGRPGEGWKIFADGDEADNVPLWKVLAQFRSDDLDEGLSLNAAIINHAKPSPVRYYNLAFVISFAFGFLSVLLLIGLLVSGHSTATDLFFYFTLAALAATIAPHLWRQAYHYGLKIPDAPLKLPHAPDRLFDEVLGYLQKVDGPKAYYLSRLRKKRVPLKRRQFFGRLRYFLFSEHSKDRGMVMRYPTAMSLPADLYLHRDDVETMLAMSRPKRRGGPGRNTKYRYDDAIIALIGDPRLCALDVKDRPAAITTVKDWLSEWFETNADASGDVPRRDQLTRYAEKICAHIETIAPAEGG